MAQLGDKTRKLIIVTVNRNISYIGYICFYGSMKDLLSFKCKIHMLIRANILDRGLVRRINYEQGSLSTAIIIDSTSEI